MLLHHLIALGLGQVKIGGGGIQMGYRWSWEWKELVCDLLNGAIVILCDLSVFLVHQLYGNLPTPNNPRTVDYFLPHVCTFGRHADEIYQQSNIFTFIPYIVAGG